MVTEIMHVFVKEAGQHQTVLEIDNCKAVVIAFPVHADSNNVVAPGAAIFAQLKPVRGAGTLPDPPPSVTNLCHIKARRMEGRSYIYLWAIGAHPDVDKEMRDNYLVSMADFVLRAADKDDLPVVAEATTQEQVELYESFGFVKMEKIVVDGADHAAALTALYTKVDPPKVEQVKEILKQHAGKESGLWAQLKTKHGADAVPPPGWPQS